MQLSKIARHTAVFSVLTAAVLAASANSQVVTAKAVGTRPDIHITFDDDAFTDIAGGSTVLSPIDGGTGDSECLTGTSYDESVVTICNDATASTFGTDSNGSYWKTVRAEGATVGGLLVNPDSPITTEYTIAVTFSVVLDPAALDYSRVIAQSAVREDGTMLRDDCGTYLQEASGETTFHPAVYCPTGMFATDRSVGVTAEDSEVITLVVTRNDEGKLCLYEISDTGAATRLVRCADDRVSDPADTNPYQINDGMIGFFMDDNREIPASANIYDIRIWDQPLNLTQLDKAYGKPDSPTNVKVKKAGAKTQVSWKAVATGPTATAYVASAFTTKKGGSAIATCSANGNGRSCKLTLQPGEYWIAVGAANDYGQSNSPRVAFTVKRK